MHSIESAAGVSSEPKAYSYIVYMWQVSVFFKYFISDETNLKVENCCVESAQLPREKMAHCANLPRDQQCSIPYASY